MKKFITLFIILTVALLSFSCSRTKPSKFYLLNTTDVAQNEASQLTKRSNFSLVIGPINFPKHLDRPQIVTRKSQNEITLSEYNRWAEPLEENFSNVLIENLSSELHTNRIIKYPFTSSQKFKYQVVIDITRFDNTSDGLSLLKARWRVKRADGREILIRSADYSEPITGKKYKDRVEAMSQNVSKLSQDISAVLLRI